MEALISSVFSALYSLIEPFIPTLITAVLIAGALAIAGYFLTTLALRAWKTFRLKLPAALFKELEALLSLDAIAELYAPAARFIEDLEDEKRHGTNAWLSPFKRAVKASAKRNPKAPRGKAFRARQQIAAAAKHVSIRTLSEHERSEIITENDSDHFVIVFKLDGNDPADFRKMTARIKGQLGLAELTENETKDAFSISFTASKVERIDILTQRKTGIEFFEEHPAQTPYSVPLAVKQNGSAWSLPIHHTLILGMTGSGKGSPIHGIIRQLEPYIEKGRARFLGIDPKATELKPYELSDLFEELAFDTAPAIDVIESLHHSMKVRAKTKKIDLKNANLGRSLEATKDNPMTILIIDEFLSFLLSLQQLGRDGKAAIALLTEILAQGRSLGIYVIAATQEADRDLIGRMRGNFSNVIVLRQPSDYFNDLFLGEGAKERGYDSSAIPPANIANGYATAGIGFAKDETGSPVKVRFIYSADEDLADIIRNHPKNGIFEDTQDDSEMPEDLGEWTFEEISD